MFRHNTPKAGFYLSGSWVKDDNKWAKVDFVEF